MFWKKARKKYGHLTSEDEDIRKFIQLSPQFQKESYLGLVGQIQDIGHRWVAQHTTAGPVLEIGFGAGRHCLFYQRPLEEYFVSEYSTWHFRPDTRLDCHERGVCCDARKLPYQNSFFQTVISIYNLEHIADLNSVFSEVHRVLKPIGRFLIALPCEGGFLWNIGRELTTRRQFKKQYGINYDKVIGYEHVWDFAGVFGQIKQSELFLIKKLQMFPFLVPSHHLNLIGCIECTVKK